MHLANDPKQKTTTLQKGDRCTFRVSDGRLSFSRGGVNLNRAMNNAEVFLVYIQHPVSKGEILSLIAETHGLTYRVVEENAGVTVYEFE